MDTTKIFWSGRSQAVRLPKDFRFEAQEVRIHRHGKAVILEPPAENRDWLDAISAVLDQDFAQAAGERPAWPVSPSTADCFRNLCAG